MGDSKTKGAGNPPLKFQQKYKPHKPTIWVRHIFRITSYLVAGNTPEAIPAIYRSFSAGFERNFRVFTAI